MTDDNRPFIDTFGIDLNYTAQNQDITILRVIWQENYFDELPGMGLQLQRSLMRYIQTDAPDMAQGDLIVKDGQNYKVVQVMPDGTGMAEAKLEKQKITP